MADLYDVIAEVLQISNKDIDDDTGPRTVGSWTSLRHLELVAAVQRAYTVRFSPREIRSIRTVRDLRELLRSRGAWSEPSSLAHQARANGESV